MHNNSTITSFLPQRNKAKLQGLTEVLPTINAMSAPGNKGHLFPMSDQLMLFQPKGNKKTFDWLLPSYYRRKSGNQNEAGKHKATTSTTALLLGSEKANKAPKMEDENQASKAALATVDQSATTEQEPAKLPEQSQEKLENASKCDILDSTAEQKQEANKTETKDTSENPKAKQEKNTDETALTPDEIIGYCLTKSQLEANEYPSKEFKFAFLQICSSSFPPSNKDSIIDL